MPPVLTTASQAQCTHGGTVLLLTSDSALLAGGSPVLLESDIHAIVGCPFTIALVYMPCVTVQWSNAATSLKVNGAGVLTLSSIGSCLNAAGAPQGMAIVSNPAPGLQAL